MNVTARPRSLAALPLWGAIRLYQRARAGRPSPCRFDPTCSTYALDALEAHGAARGSWLTVRRVSRCHPWGGSGYDPVPEPRFPDGKV
jgi:putative membrane protein insertion efficiency factor